MKTLTLALILFAAPAAAQSLKLPTQVFLFSSAADWTSTAYGLSKTACNCHEANPLIKWAEPLGTPALITIAVTGDLATLYLAHRVFGQKHRKLMRIGLYSLAAVRFAAAASNMHQSQRHYGTTTD